MDLDAWLRGLGLQEYEAAFRQNHIDDSVLPSLTAEDLKDLGIGSIGHRRKLLEAIALLRAEPTTKAPPPEAPTTVPKPTQDTAERRQVTVMFSDLVGSTALSARMDPEDLREVISAYQKCVTKTVQRFGGFVAKYMGDGVLVYFGYPQAHEHDAERAVRAGLELIAAVNALKTGASLQTRIGIATGLVIVGDLIGSGSAQEQAVVGETPNLAARLQGIAEPNTVVIAESTRKLLGNLFELDALEIRDLKGIERVRAWAAVRASSVEGRFDALHAVGLTALVGREEELELLLRRWSKAKTGEGQVVLLSGEAGIGKSRLTAALLERIVDEPHTRLRYFCSAQHIDSAFYPIIGQMERAAGFVHDDTQQAKLDKLDAVLAHTSTRIEDAAMFAEMLSLPNDGRYPALNLTPDQRRQGTLKALTSRLAGLASENPVLVVVEDVHWIDPTSLEVFGRTVDQIKTLPVLLTVTFRPEFNPPWVGQSHVMNLTLNRLGEREAIAIIARFVGNKELPADVMAEIVERTDGIPLFVEEMTKAVLEAESEGAAWRTVGVVPSPALAVPASLHASLMARLDRLGPAKEVAQTGAALGRSFSHELISAVAQMPKQKLNEALEQLVAAELIFGRGTPPGAEYTFKHALVQDAAYSTLLRGRRQQIHALIATTLESQFPEVVAAQPQVVAHHCAEAKLTEKAVSYRLTAGQQAMARSAMTEAVSHLRKGIDLTSQLPEGAKRQQHELDLQVTIGRALMATRGFAAPEVGETCARARQLCDQLNRPQFVPVLFGQWAHHFLRAELDQARDGAAEMLQLGEKRNDLTVKLLGRQTLGLTSFSLGNFASCRENLEHAAALYDPAHLAEYYTTLNPSNPYLVGQLWLSRALGCLGYLDQARTKMEWALTKARQLGHAFTITHALVEICIAEWGLRAPEELLPRADELVSLAAEQFTMFEPQGMMFRGWCLTALGQEDGTALVKSSLAAFRATGSSLWVPFFLTLLADTYGKAGRPKEGLACLDEAARLVEVTNERATDAEIHRVRGELLTALQDIPAATVELRTGIEFAHRQQARLFELRAAASLARLWRDQGKRTEARDLLSPVYGWFTEGFDTMVLREARVLLEELA
jgi:class 3 adenylate cyclase/tetratricopeptide (TPR) repeat protein